MAAPAPLIVAVLVPLIVWRIYRRVRRNIGRQRSRVWRHWAGTVLSPLLLALFAALAFRSPIAQGVLAGGIAIGVAFAAWGLRLTRFERAPDGFFYTPNAYLGVALSMLLVARVVYRLFEIYTTPAAQGAPDFVRSPLTLAVVGLVFGYYAMYSAGLLRWRVRSRAV